MFSKASGAGAAGSEHSERNIDFVIGISNMTWPGLAAVMGGFANLTAAGMRTTDILNKNMTSMGAGFMALGGTAALAIGLMTAEAVKFESKMKEVETLIMKTGASSEQMAGKMQGLSDMAQRLAVDYGVSPGDIAESFKVLGRAGITKQKDLEEVQKASLMMAKIEGITPELASRHIVQTTNLFGLDYAKNSMKVAEILTHAANISTTSVDDIAKAMQHVGGTFSAAYGGASDKAKYQNLEMASAAVAALSQKGVSGSMSGVAIKSFMNYVISNQAKSMKQLKVLDLDPKQFIKRDPETGKMVYKNLYEMYNLFQDKFEQKGWSNAQILAWFTKWGERRQAQQYEKLFEKDAKTGKNLFEEYLKQMKETYSLQERYDRVMQSASGSWDRLSAAIQVFSISIGSKFLVIFKPVIDMFTKLASLLADNTVLASAFALLLGGAVVAGLYSVGYWMKPIFSKPLKGLMSGLGGAKDKLAEKFSDKGVMGTINSSLVEEEKATNRVTNALDKKNRAKGRVTAANERMSKSANKSAGAFTGVGVGADRARGKIDRVTAETKKYRMDLERSLDTPGNNILKKELLRSGGISPVGSGRVMTHSYSGKTPVVPKVDRFMPAGTMAMPHIMSLDDQVKYMQNRSLLSGVGHYSGEWIVGERKVGGVGGVTPGSAVTQFKTAQNKFGYKGLSLGKLGGVSPPVDIFGNYKEERIIRNFEKDYKEKIKKIENDSIKEGKSRYPFNVDRIQTQLENYQQQKIIQEAQARYANVPMAQPGWRMRARAGLSWAGRVPGRLASGAVRAGSIVGRAAVSGTRSILGTLGGFLGIGPQGMALLLGAGVVGAGAYTVGKNQGWFDSPDDLMNRGLKTQGTNIKNTRKHLDELEKKYGVLQTTQNHFTKGSADWNRLGKEMKGVKGEIEGTKTSLEKQTDAYKRNRRLVTEIRTQAKDAINSIGEAASRAYLPVDQTGKYTGHGAGSGQEYINAGLYKTQQAIGVTKMNNDMLDLLIWEKRGGMAPGGSKFGQYLNTKGGQKFYTGQIDLMSQTNAEFWRAQGYDVDPETGQVRVDEFGNAKRLDWMGRTWASGTAWFKKNEYRLNIQNKKRTPGDSILDGKEWLRGSGMGSMITLTEQGFGGLGSFSKVTGEGFGGLGGALKTWDFVSGLFNQKPEKKPKKKETPTKNVTIKQLIVKTDHNPQNIADMIAQSIFHNALKDDDKKTTTKTINIPGLPQVTV